MSKYLFVIFLLAVFISCKSTSLFQEEQNTTEKISIGNVGLNKDYLLENGYKNTSIPQYKTPIKVSAVLLPFTKKRFHAFLDAKDEQASKVNITYVDSLEKKPKYLRLKISDKVTVLGALNDKSNIDVKKYLATEYKAVVVTQASIAFNQDILNVIQESDHIFLVQNGLKSYGIQPYKKGKKLKIINFSAGVVFSYKTQNCCWKANSKYKVDIADLVDDKTECPNKTYSSANRAERKINFYKL